MYKGIRIHLIVYFLWFSFKVETIKARGRVWLTLMWIPKFPTLHLNHKLYKYIKDQCLLQHNSYLHIWIYFLQSNGREWGKKRCVLVIVIYLLLFIIIINLFHCFKQLFLYAKSKSTWEKMWWHECKYSKLHRLKIVKALNYCENQWGSQALCRGRPLKSFTHRHKHMHTQKCIYPRAPAPSIPESIERLGMYPALCHSRLCGMTHSQIAVPMPRLLEPQHVFHVLWMLHVLPQPIWTLDNINNWCSRGVVIKLVNYAGKITCNYVTGGYV